MPDVFFDGANLHITLPNIGSFNTQGDIYSAWKEWLRQGDNAKYPIAFETTGGDDVGAGQTIAPYFFCRNDLGWRIKMPQDNGEIVVEGNLFPRDPNASLFEQSSGYDAFLRLEVSTRAVVVEVGSAAPTTPVEDLTNLGVILGADGISANLGNQIQVDLASELGAKVGDKLTVKRSDY